MSAGPTRLVIDGQSRRIELEYQLLPGPALSPLIVFLHEGLGSVSMWRGFPAQLCQHLGCRGLVYSRPGYGQSSPRLPDEHWAPDYLEHQAAHILPQLLHGLNITEPVWLLGHSDGGSIALLCAILQAEREKAGLPPASFMQVEAVIVMAPHIMVEDLSVRSIEEARQAYLKGDLRQGLSRHHADPDSAFWGWNQAWLSDGFRRWSIEDRLHQIKVPLLAIQGQADEYGTLEQIRGIARRVPQTELLELPDCGHSPQRDQPEALMSRIEAFLRKQGQLGPDPNRKS
jgi:pimeloyl-ACP methyl ester carboxylesterase